MADNAGAWWCCGWHPGPDRGVISRRLRRTCARTRRSSDILCSFSEVLRRFGLLQRNAGVVTTGSDHAWVPDDRSTDARPRFPFSLSFLKKNNWSPLGRDGVMTVHAWEQRAGRATVSMESEGQVPHAGPPPPAPLALSSRGSPSPSQGAWVGPYPARISGWGVGGGQDADGEHRRTGREGEIYQIVPKRGKSLSAFQEGRPCGRRRPPHHDEAGHGALVLFR